MPTNTLEQLFSHPVYVLDSNISSVGALAQFNFRRHGEPYEVGLYMSDTPMCCEHICVRRHPCWRRTLRV